MFVAWMIAGMGLVLAAVAVATARGGRLSIGHGTALALCGFGLLAAGLLLGFFARGSARFTVGGAVVLAFGLLLALALALAHAVALTRLQERVRFLAQEIALLRGAAERSDESTAGAPPRTP
jgi:hypothetical protein